MDGLLSELDKLSKEVISCVNKYGVRKISYVLLAILSIIVLSIIAGILSKITRKLNLNKLVVSNKIDDVKKLLSANLIHTKDFIVFPELIKNNWTGIATFLLKSGYYLTFPSSLQKKYFGEVLQFDNTGVEPIEQGGIEVSIVNAIFIPKKTSRLTIRIKNTGNSDFRLKMPISDNYLNKWIELLLNNKNKIEVQYITEKSFLNGGTLIPSELLEFDIYFQTLDREHIRKIRKINLNIYFKSSKHGERKDFHFKNNLRNVEDDEVEKILDSEFDTAYLFKILTFGGFFIIVIPIIIFLLLLGAIINLLLIPNLLICIFISIFALNINSKYAQILYDRFKSRLEKNTYNEE